MAGVGVTLGVRNSIRWRSMPKVTLRSARTEHSDPEKAADDLIEQLGDVQPRLVTLFASRDHDHSALNRAVWERLPKGTRLVGATSAGELDRTGLHMGSAVLGALEGDLEVGIGIGRDLSEDALKAGSHAMREACAQLGTTPRDLDERTHVGLVMDDAFQQKKEELLMGALEQNQGLQLVGGGANDLEMDPSKATSLLHADDNVEGDCVVIAMIRTRAPFAALRHHAYTPTSETLTITKVSDDGYRAIEIDGQPAVKRYADVIGVEIADLPFGEPKGFSDRPLAMRVGREYFMRSPMWPKEDGSIEFANLLEEGAEYELMKMGDMPAMTRTWLTEELPRRVRNPQAAIIWHCGGREYIAMKNGTYGELSKTFESAPPCVGFNVRFEIYCGFHINTTLTALVFGSDE